MLKVNIKMISSKIYQIGPIHYDSSTRVLTHKNGYTEYFTPRVSDVFLLLLEYQGQCVEKDLLLSQCWGDVIVSEQALTNVISKLRKILHKNCPDILTITTVSKSGYLLEVVGSVQKEGDINDCDVTASIVKEQTINSGTAAIPFESNRAKANWLSSNKITVLLIFFLGVLLTLTAYNYYEIKSRPYFINKSSYSEAVNIRNNTVYIHTVNNSELDSSKIIEEIKQGISSICNAEVYVRFYNNTRIKNHVGLVIFIITNDGRAFNFRMSEYTKDDLGERLNYYLMGKSVAC